MAESFTAENVGGTEALNRRAALTKVINEATVGNLRQVLTRIAEEVETATEREIYIRQLSEKLDVTRKALASDLNDVITLTGGTKGRIQKSALVPDLVDVVLNDEGYTTYLIKKGHNLEMKSHVDVKGTKFIPPEESLLLFDPVVHGNAVIDLYQKGDDPTLFDDVLTQLSRFSYLKDEHWLIATNFVFLSHLHDHPDVYYMPIIYFYASPSRGKTRTGKSMVYLSYRGHHCIDLKQAHMFRSAEYLCNTVFYDVMDIWKRAEKTDSVDILMSRYEKGGRVYRVTNFEKGAFDDMRSFKSFSPTIMASNVPVHNILETRCIPITMPNKPCNFESPSPDKFVDLRARMTAWRARLMNAPLPVIKPIDGIDGRLWDIAQPLLQVCQMASPSKYDDLLSALLEIAGVSKSEQRETIDGRIVSIIRDICEKENVRNIWIIPTSDVLKQFNDDTNEKYAVTPQWMGRKLKGMGINSRIVGGRSQIEIDRGTLNTMLEQCGYEQLLKKDGAIQDENNALDSSNAPKLFKSIMG